jgi:YD repeat-containing protein
MKIQKPHKFILTTKYFNSVTGEEIPYSQINKHICWHKKKYSNNGKLIYYENCSGYWEKYEYNNDGRLICYMSSKGTYLQWKH